MGYNRGLASYLAPRSPVSHVLAKFFFTLGFRGIIKGNRHFHWIIPLFSFSKFALLFFSRRPCQHTPITDKVAWGGDNPLIAINILCKQDIFTSFSWKLLVFFLMITTGKFFVSPGGYIYCRKKKEYCIWVVLRGRKKKKTPLGAWASQRKK